MEIVERRLKEFGIPNVDIKIDEIKGYDKRYSHLFVCKNENLVIIGEDYYRKCIRLMKLKFLNCKYLYMKWLTQSMLDKNINTENIDVLALVQLYEEMSEYNKNLSGKIINNVIRNGGQVLIGCDNMDSLQMAFPYDLDMIEVEFFFWRDK